VRLWLLGSIAWWWERDESEWEMI